MTGETLREIGVLVLVFVPIDSLFGRDPLTVMRMAAIVVAAVFLIAVGMLLQLEWR